MEIEKLYESIKEEIDKKIDEYKEAFNYDNKDFFAEIAFCILTPQSKALNAWKIIQTLKENDLLFTADSDLSLIHI